MRRGPVPTTHTWQGVTRTVAEWAAALDITIPAFRKRLRQHAAGQLPKAGVYAAPTTPTDEEIVAALAEAGGDVQQAQALLRERGWATTSRTALRTLMGTRGLDAKSP